MTKQTSWQKQIHYLLTTNGQFKLIDTKLKADTLTAYYQQQIGDKETVIMAGHLKDERLITLDITNPKTPGHNAEQIEYFYEHDFDDTKSIKIVSVGLPFKDVNIDAVTSILQSGLSGTEIKYFSNNKLQFSTVTKPVGAQAEFFSTTHYFSDKNFWIRIFKKLIRPNAEYKTEEIDLSKIFSGVK